MNHRRIAVVDWTAFPRQLEAWNAAKRAPLGGLGGWFGAGQRWADYLRRCPIEARPYAEGLRAAVLKRRLREGGEWHQTDARGVPVFRDGSLALFSWRARGDFQAAVWSTADGFDYHYLDFYFGAPEDLAGVQAG